MGLDFVHVFVVCEVFFNGWLIFAELVHREANIARLEYFVWVTRRYVMRILLFSVLGIHFNTEPLMIFFGSQVEFWFIDHKKPRRVFLTETSYSLTSIKVWKILIWRTKPLIVIFHSSYSNRGFSLLCNFVWYLVFVFSVSQLDVTTSFLSIGSTTGIFTGVTEWLRLDLGETRAPEKTEGRRLFILSAIVVVFHLLF